MCIRDSSGGPGGRGAFINGVSTLFTSGSTLTGGDGGQVSLAAPFCGAGGDGGAGLEIDGTDAIAYIRDSAITGGEGGTPTEPGCLPGNNAPNILQVHGQVFFFTEPSLPFTTSSPVKENESVTLSFEGQAGSCALYFFSAAQGAEQTGVFELGGLIVLGSPKYAAVAGVIPSSGSLDVSLQVPAMGPLANQEARTVYLQSVVASPSSSGKAFIGEPTSVVLMANKP